MESYQLNTIINIFYTCSSSMVCFYKYLWLYSKLEQNNRKVTKLNLLTVLFFHFSSCFSKVFLVYCLDFALYRLQIPIFSWIGMHHLFLFPLPNFQHLDIPWISPINCFIPDSTQNGKATLNLSIWLLICMAPLKWKSGDIDIIIPVLYLNVGKAFIINSYYPTSKSR